MLNLKARMANKHRVDINSTERKIYIMKLEREYLIEDLRKNSHCIDSSIAREIRELDKDILRAEEEAAWEITF